MTASPVGAQGSESHASELVVRSGPFLKRPVTTARLMADVLLACVPVLAAAFWTFGLSAPLIVLASTLGATLAEWAFISPTRLRPRGATLRDGSAVLTGVLLGLTLPPTLPLWMAFLGGAAGIGLGKIIWGGLGNNLFNPALVGRAFLQAAFPTSLTSWSAPVTGAARFSVSREILAPPLLHASREAGAAGDAAIDAVTSATPLAAMKFDSVATPLRDLLAGSTSGSLGETSAALLLVIGVVLALRRTYDWRIPAGIVLSTAVLSGIFFLLSPDRFPSPLFMIGSGGLLFGAVFMATDPVTSPIAPRGAWIFGAGIGALVVLIRLFGGLPEGVMYAILLMNATTPLIDRKVRPRGFGRGKRKLAVAR